MRHDRTDTHSSEGCVQRPVAEAVLQEEVELLLDKPRDGGPIEEELGHLTGEPSGSYFKDRLCGGWEWGWGV